MWPHRKPDATPKKPSDAFLSMVPRLSPIDPKGLNFVFSPLSLRAVVSLVAAGASGPTLKQLLSFLDSDSVHDLNAHSSALLSSVSAGSTDTGPKISFANAVWVHHDISLKPSYKHVVDNVYKASVYQVDFVNTEPEEIVSDVNSWAEEKTNGLIKEVLEPSAVDMWTRFILVNALYFKGEWSGKYFKVPEREDTFFLLGGGGDDAVKVPFMTNNMDSYVIETYTGFKVLRLPYKRGMEDEHRFSMYILLPDSKDGLPFLVEKIASEPDFLGRHLPRFPVPVNKFRIPRFKIEFGFEASKAFKEMGVSLPFDPEAEGFMEMVDSVKEGKELYVSEIYHKCVIEVNEHGTEAAGFTGISLSGGGGGRPQKVDFVADHPFMFLIREEATGAVLFLGHLLNPLRG